MRSDIVTRITRYSHPRYNPDIPLEQEGEKIPGDEEWVYVKRQFLMPYPLLDYIHDSGLKVKSSPFLFQEQLGIDYDRSSNVPTQSALLVMTATKPYIKKNITSPSA